MLTLLPPQSGAKFELPAYLSAISMTVELFRRTIWSFFRLEHEHRQNTQGFRRVNVVPLHFNTGVSRELSLLFLVHLDVHKLTLIASLAA